MINQEIEYFGPSNTDRDGTDINWYVTTKCCRYDPETGEILSSGTISYAGIKHMEQEFGYHYLKVEADADIHFVDVVKKRRRHKSACPATLDGLTLRNVPLPSKIEISNPFYAPTVYDEIDDGIVELEFDHPGTYKIRVLSVKHTPGEFEVTVP